MHLKKYKPGFNQRTLNGLPKVSFTQRTLPLDIFAPGLPGQFGVPALRSTSCCPRRLQAALRPSDLTQPRGAKPLLTPIRALRACRLFACAGHKDDLHIPFLCNIVLLWDDVEKNIHGDCCGKGRYLDLYHPTLLPRRADGKAVLCTAADPETKGEALKALYDRCSEPPLCFGGRFHARTALHSLCSVTKSQIVSVFPAPGEKTFKSKLLICQYQSLQFIDLCVG
jgi:hypothetical protein